MKGWPPGYPRKGSSAAVDVLKGAFLGGAVASAYVLAETERKKNALADAAAEKAKSTSTAETLGGFLFGNKN